MSARSEQGDSHLNSSTNLQPYDGHVLTPELDLSLSWHRVLTVTAAAVAAPASPGIYAYAETTPIYGLPSKLAWVYIGQARNLKARLQQHSARNDPHPQLQDWLHQRANREVWYATIPLESLDSVERTLISSIKPRLNRRLYDSVEPSEPNPAKS